MQWCLSRATVCSLWHCDQLQGWVWLKAGTIQGWGLTTANYCHCFKWSFLARSSVGLEEGKEWLIFKNTRYSVGLNLPVVACFLLPCLWWEWSSNRWLFWGLWGTQSSLQELWKLISEQRPHWEHRNSLILENMASRSLGLYSWEWPWTSDLPASPSKCCDAGHDHHAQCMGC